MTKDVKKIELVPAKIRLVEIRFRADQENGLYGDLEGTGTWRRLGNYILPYDYMGSPLWGNEVGILIKFRNRGGSITNCSLTYNKSTGFKSTRQTIRRLTEMGYSCESDYYVQQNILMFMEKVIGDILKDETRMS